MREPQGCARPPTVSCSTQMTMLMPWRSVSTSTRRICGCSDASDPRGRARLKQLQRGPRNEHAELVAEGKDGVRVAADEDGGLARAVAAARPLALRRRVACRLPKRCAVGVRRQHLARAAGRDDILKEVDEKELRRRVSTNCGAATKHSTPAVQSASCTASIAATCAPKWPWPGRPAPPSMPGGRLLREFGGTAGRREPEIRRLRSSAGRCTCLTESSLLTADVRSSTRKKEAR